MTMTIPPPPTGYVYLGRFIKGPTPPLNLSLLGLWQKEGIWETGSYLGNNHQYRYACTEDRYEKYSPYYTPVEIEDEVPVPPHLTLPTGTVALGYGQEGKHLNTRLHVFTGTEWVDQINYNGNSPIYFYAVDKRRYHRELIIQRITLPLEYIL